MSARADNGTEASAPATNLALQASQQPSSVSLLPPQPMIGHVSAAARAGSRGESPQQGRACC